MNQTVKIQKKKRIGKRILLYDINMNYVNNLLNNL